MCPETVKWGIVSTIKAEAEDILAFAAHHLDAGAHRLFLYLDAPSPEALPHLKAHPKIRVTECGDAYWRRQGHRPAKHQVRQAANATRAYQCQAKDVDWLLHCDVDEFLYAHQDTATQLAMLPPAAICARVRPVELLSGGDGTAFKAPLPRTSGGGVAGDLYPEYGEYLRSGFLSHVQGKLFVRTGLDGMEVRIHNVGLDGEENPGQTELAEADLCHLHARDWHSWLGHYRYRLQMGSYRPGLQPARPRDLGGLTLHELLSTIEAAEGEAGLRGFFNEICADSPNLRERLEAAGLLRIRDLDLDAKRQKHFPDFA